jgi:hypothetical protein
LLKDFKAFIMRGNVVDMAVGIIIGAAFGPIVGSFVKDIIDRTGPGQSGFREPADRSQGRGHARTVRLPGRRPGRGSRLHQLWHLHQHRDQFPHHRGGGVLLHRQADCKAECPAGGQDGRTTGGPDGQRMPVLLHQHSHQGHPVSQLHFTSHQVDDGRRIAWVRTTAMTSRRAPACRT